jgi:hypothetical protein
MSYRPPSSPAARDRSGIAIPGRLRHALCGQRVDDQFDEPDLRHGEAVHPQGGEVEEAALDVTDGDLGRQARHPAVRLRFLLRE